MATGMVLGIVSGLLGGAIAVALLTYFSTRIRNNAVDGTLRYEWWFALLGMACLAFVAFAVGAISYYGAAFDNNSEFFSAIGIIIGFGVAAVYCFGEYFLVRGVYDDEHIDFYTPWTGRKIERWCDLESATFNRLMKWYVLRFKSGNSIRLSNLISGYGGVLDKLRENA